MTEDNEIFTSSTSAADKLSQAKTAETFSLNVAACFTFIT